MSEKLLSLEQECEIKEKAISLKDEKKIWKVYPMVVFDEGDEKVFYVAYMANSPFIYSYRKI